jgi:hypothetical protein
MFCTVYHPTTLSLGLRFLTSSQDQKTSSCLHLKTKTVPTAKRGVELTKCKTLVKHLAISYSQKNLKLAVKQLRVYGNGE